MHGFFLAAPEGHNTLHQGTLFFNIFSLHFKILQHICKQEKLNFIVLRPAITLITSDEKYCLPSHNSDTFCEAIVLVILNKYSKPV